MRTTEDKSMMEVLKTTIVKLRGELVRTREELEREKRAMKCFRREVQVRKEQR